MVPFAIGSETAGSMTYPGARCGVTALRPTFGTVGRTGVMSISESLVYPKIFSFGHFPFFSHPFLLVGPVWFQSKSPVFDRISSDHSVEVLLIAQLFWMLFKERIQMISHQETFHLLIHSQLTLQNLQLAILRMLRWRLEGLFLYFILSVN